MKTKLDRTDVEGVVSKIHYHQVPESRTIICALTLKNGFVVTGESSCVHESTFDESIGKDLAFRNAIDKVYMVEGYLLRQKLFEQAEAAKPPKRTPVDSVTVPNANTMEVEYWVRWSDGAKECLTREQAVELRKTYPVLWAASYLGPVLGARA